MAREDKKNRRAKRVREREVYKKAVHMELREHKSSFFVYVVLRLLVIFTLVMNVVRGNYENVFVCLLTLVLLIIPSLIQVTIKIELPTVLEIIMLLFIFAAEILGEINAFYVRIPGWDTILHTLNGFVMAAVGFALVDILNRNERFSFRLSPVFLAIVAFCFSMTIGVMWEFFECGMDLFFHLDMQKDMVIHSITSVMLDPAGKNLPVTIGAVRDVAVNGQSLGLGGYLDVGLYDTMKDLFVNFVGAVIFSFIGYFYVKRRGEGKFAGQFIPKLKKKERDFLRIAEKESECDQQKETMTGKGHKKNDKRRV